MSHRVEVHQVGPTETSRAFLNIDAQPLSIMAWGSSYNRPTYLLVEGFTFYLIQFDSEECAQEWLTERLPAFTRGKPHELIRLDRRPDEDRFFQYVEGLALRAGGCRWAP